jgi:hypothetical protein
MGTHVDQVLTRQGVAPDEFALIVWKREQLAALGSREDFPARHGCSITKVCEKTSQAGALYTSSEARSLLENGS